MRFTDDGMYYWDGTAWVSAVSPDGRFRWNGSQWIPMPALPGVAYSPGPIYAQPAHPQPAAVRVPTSWTRPLQYAVAAWFAMGAVITLSLPFWMSGVMNQIVAQSIQRQQQLDPTAPPLPAGFADSMSTLMTGILWLSVLVGLALYGAGVVGALRRWTWLYYVVLVWLGLGVLSLPLNVVNALTGGSALTSAMTASSGFSMPAGIYWMGIISSVPGSALFVWMLVAIVKRGPWGMVRQS
jgi:hypothetical protein